VNPAGVVLSWYEESRPLMGALGNCIRVGVMMVGATADDLPPMCNQLRIETRNGERWLLAHPCPDSEVEEKCEEQLRLWVGRAALYSSLAAQAAEPGAVELPDSDLDQRLGEHTAAAAHFMMEIDQHILMLQERRGT
jgi:hypothetical protein